MDSLIVLGARYLFLFVILGATVPIFRLQKEDRVRYVVTALVSGTIAFATTKLAGSLYFDPRPFTHGVHALIPHEPDNGFPSDHTVLAFTAALLTLKISKPLCIGLVLVAAIVGVCRVLAGIHNPLDVVTGVALGGLSVIVGSSVTNLAYSRKTLRPSKE